MSKININNTSSIDAIRQASQNKVNHTDKSNTAKAESKPEVSKDQLEFSSKATDVGKFVNQIKDLPEIRENKVDAVKAQISSNEFNPSNEEIADALLNEE